MPYIGKVWKNQDSIQKQRMKKAFDYIKTKRINEKLKFLRLQAEETRRFHSERALSLKDSALFLLFSVKTVDKSFYLCYTNHSQTN